jgi:hypothetical protein
MIDANHSPYFSSWFGRRVELDGYFLDTVDVSAGLTAAGFSLYSRIDRQPMGEVNYPSRRCYLMAQR